jgi:membrane-associated protease RseP (regulator of RpoE activity)
VLYALADPASLVVLLLAFVVGVTLVGWVSCLVTQRAGDRRPAQEGRLSPDPRRQVDPFGAVSAAVSGLGWARPVPLHDRHRRGAAVAVALSGPLVVAALGLGLLVLWAALSDPFARGTLLGQASLVVGPSQVLQQGGPLDLSSALFLTGCSLLYVGALSLVPLPPLPGGLLLLALAPRSRGWQQAEHQLVERNIGIAVLLALMLIPLGGSSPMLPQLLDIVLTPLIRAVTGA